MFRCWDVLDRIVLFCIVLQKGKAFVHGIVQKCACYLFKCVDFFFFLFSSFFFCLFETNHGDYKVRGNNNTENMILLDYMPSKFVVLCFVRVFSVSLPLDSFIFVLCSHSHFAGLSLSLFHGYVRYDTGFVFKWENKIEFKKKRETQTEEKEEEEKNAHSNLSLSRHARA